LPGDLRYLARAIDLGILLAEGERCLIVHGYDLAWEGDLNGGGRHRDDAERKIECSLESLQAFKKEDAGRILEAQ
jgi:hypothetical protein